MAVKQSWRNRDYQKHVFKVLGQCRDILFFDTETTGLSAKKNHIIEIAAIKYRLGEDEFLHEVDRLHQYIRPAYMLDPVIVNLTGITDEFLSTYPYEDECFNQIHDFFGNGPLVVCGHNVKFDTGFLEALYSRNGGGGFVGYQEIDTCEMARDIIPASDTENYKLGTLAAVCGIDDGVQFHSALDDIQVTAKLFQVLYLEYLARQYDEKDRDESQSKHRPEVKSVKFWEGFQGYSRIYVDTSAGSLYYDVRRKAWMAKNIDLNTVDVGYIERRCWEATGCCNAEQFSKFKSRVYL